MLKSTLLKGATAIFAGHVTHHCRVGEIMVSNGAITAQADRFTIRVRGKGGHGARPHEAVDAVVITGILITTIQTLVSRHLSDFVQRGQALHKVRDEACGRGRPSVPCTGIPDRDLVDLEVLDRLDLSRHDLLDLLNHQQRGCGLRVSAAALDKGGVAGRFALEDLPDTFSLSFVHTHAFPWAVERKVG